jgi:toxin ParE1/3/4
VVESVPSNSVALKCLPREVGLHEGHWRKPKPLTIGTPRNSAAAEAFIDELDHAFEQIRAFPNVAGSHTSGTRRYVMRRFPFTVIYRERQLIVEVVAIAHGRRKPGYWKKRLITESPHGTN